MTDLRRPLEGFEQPFRPLVAFDFDGTLTCRESFTDFLAWLHGRRRQAMGMARLAPSAMTYLLNRRRGTLKAAMVNVFLKGIPRETLEREAVRYATEMSPRLLRPDALRAWRQWQGRKARLVIVTASPEFLVAPFAHGLGADHLIATQLIYDDRGRVEGGLYGRNCRGAEKVVRLKAMFGEDLNLEAAYGDSDGDREMLAIAAEPGLKVFSAKP